MSSITKPINASSAGAINAQTESANALGFSTVRPAYRTSIKHTDQERLTEMASALSQPRELLCQIEGLFRGIPDKRSVWAADRRNTLTGPAGPWGRGPVDHQVGLALLYLRVASDHLAGLAGLYNAGEIFYAPRPLVRSAFEHGTRVTWILDPTATLRQRCARAALDEYGSALESNKAVRHLGPSGSPEAALTKALLNGIKDHIHGLFDPSEVMLAGSRRDWRIEGESALTPTDVAIFHANAHGGLVRGDGIYDALSLFDHPQGFLAREAPAQNGENSAVDVTLEFLARLTTSAVSPAYSGILLVLSYAGWGLRNVDRWGADFERVFPGMVR